MPPQTGGVSMHLFLPLWSDSESLPSPLQLITKETFPDWVSFFFRSLNQPQAQRKTQPPNLHQTWEGFFRDSLYNVHKHKDITNFLEFLTPPPLVCIR